MSFRQDLYRELVRLQVQRENLRRKLRPLLDDIQRNERQFFQILDTKSSPLGKDRYSHKGWLPWVNENLGLTERIRLARLLQQRSQFRELKHEYCNVADW